MLRIWSQRKIRRLIATKESQRTKGLGVEQKCKSLLKERRGDCAYENSYDSTTKFLHYEKFGDIQSQSISMMSWVLAASYRPISLCHICGKVRRGKKWGSITGLSPQPLHLRPTLLLMGKCYILCTFFMYLVAPVFQEYVDRGKSIPIGLAALFLRVLPSYYKESIRKVENEWCGPKRLTLLTRSSCLTISTLLPLLGSPLLSNLLRSGFPIPKFWYMD